MTITSTARWQAWAGETADTMHLVATRATREAAMSALTEYLAERASAVSASVETVRGYVRTQVKPHPDDDRYDSEED